MKIIDEAFKIIKETSGITDIEEIMNTFIKSEEQNYSLFNYVNVLTQDIDFLEENNKDLNSEIVLLEVSILMLSEFKFRRKNMSKNRRPWRKLLKRRLKSKNFKKLFAKSIFLNHYDIEL